MKGRYCFTGVPNLNSISEAVYELLEFQKLKIGPTHTHTHTFRRQLKIIFLSVLAYSQYSGTNISIFFVSRKQLPQWGKKGCESRFPYYFLTDFTMFFLWGSTLLDFEFLTEGASWIHRIFLICFHGKKKFKFV